MTSELQGHFSPAARVVFQHRASPSGGIRRQLWPLAHAHSGYFAVGVFLVVGHAVCHMAGPAVIVSVIVAALTSITSGRRAVKRLPVLWNQKRHSPKNSLPGCVWHS